VEDVEGVTRDAAGRPKIVSVARDQVIESAYCLQPLDEKGHSGEDEDDQE